MEGACPALGVADPFACSPTTNGGRGYSFFSTSPRPSQILNLLQGWVEQDAEASALLLGRPPILLLAPGHRLGRDWGHRASTGMRRRERRRQRPLSLIQLR